MDENIKGTTLGPEAGPYVEKLMKVGFVPSLRVEPLVPPLVDQESGAVFLAKVLLLLIPVRSPATKSKDPLGAEVLANLPVEVFAREIELKETGLRDRYADKCAEAAWKMLAERAPEAIR
jgi:hypothetical protein